MIIYKITNSINNKIYIGQTIRSLNKRISEYKYEHLNSLSYNDYLFRSFHKYGFNNFKFEIIDTASTINELNEKEILWISFYNSTNKMIGYNILYGGNNSIKPNETKEKMSMAHKGTKQSSNWINNRISKAGSYDAKKYGRIKTNDEKQHLSINAARYWNGKSRDNKTKERISKTKKLQNIAPPNSKKVEKYNIHNGDVLGIYRSTCEAAKFNTDLSQSTISRYCNGQQPKNKDIGWRFVNEDSNNTG